MAKEPFRHGLSPSLIDRLVDQEPKVREEPNASQSQSMRELRNSLRRDLEWLLNTRRSPVDLPTHAQELPRSVFAYGLPDITSLSFSSPADRHRLVMAMEEAITFFEPRLMNVEVVLQPVSEVARVLRFHVEALLRVEPAPERISFDTALELTNGEYHVGGDARAR